LSQNAKFWIVYLKLVQEKITDEDTKSRFRDEITKSFKETSEWTLIMQELGGVLNIVEEQVEEKENSVPYFGQENADKHT
jgi:hypothetical protein